MLATHQNTDEQVGNFLGGHSLTVLVSMVLEQSVDEVTVLDIFLHSSSLNNGHVCVTDLLLGEITLSVRGQGKIGEDKVEGGKAVVKIRVELGEIAVELGSDLVTKQTSRGSEDSHLGLSGHDVSLTALALKVSGKKVGDLLHDLRNVRSEGVSSEGTLAELLLLHKSRVGTVVNNAGAKNRGGKMGVSLLGRHVSKLGVEDELVALGTQRHGHDSTKHVEGKHVAVTGSAVFEEFVRVDTVGNRRSDPRDPVESHGSQSLVSSSQQL